VTAGQVTVHGEDMLRAPAPVRRRIRRDHLGAVFQDPMTSLNPTMRIGQQVAEAAGSEQGPRDGHCPVPRGGCLKLRAVQGETAHLHRTELLRQMQ
jgi:ABC-type microcin C transport system duplicated ATPase subunit YejF